MNDFRMLAIGAAFLTLTACGGDNSEAAKETAATVSDEIATSIKTRQETLKSLGGAFKSISDQLRSSDPSLDDIRQGAAKAAEIAAMDFPSWFVDGSGPESGVDTDALPAIWEDPEGFASAHQRLQAAAAELQAAADAGDIDDIKAKFQATGAACKNCHDNYRADDN